jgi:WD40 repeat protein
MHGRYSVSAEPYPGLRSFRKDENDIFFGRDDHVAEMLAKLAQAHFLCVTGPSGCGKSSLARTGLMNSLEAGFLPGSGSDWIFCDFRPGDRPFRRLIRTLAGAIAGDLPGSTEPSPKAKELANLFLHHFEVRRQSNDLNDVLRDIDLGGRPILVLVDQFEELFRFAQSDPHAAVKFVEILLQTAAAKRDVYVVITIRTDELEKCARYAGLTKAINASQFLTPTLDRYQIQEAIEGPIALFGGRIDPKLSVWLLNSLEEELDKLPLMQHALKIVYAHKTAREGRPDVTLGVEDFVAAFDLDPKLDFLSQESRRALRNSLSKRLDQIYESLPDRLKPGAERTFCALTAIETGSRDIRRPLQLGRLALTIGETVETAREIVEAFSSGEEAYLYVRGGRELATDDTIDVTHECVLRLWSRLQTDWLVKEKESADNIRLLGQLARTWEESREGASFGQRILAPDVLKGYTLERFRRWRAEAQPNPDWAQRYLSGFRWPSETDGRDLPPNAIFARIAALFAASLRHKRWSEFAKASSVFVLVGLIVFAFYQELEKKIAAARNLAERERNSEINLTKQQVATATPASQQPADRISTGRDGLRGALTLDARRSLVLDGEPDLVSSAFSAVWQTLSSSNELYRYSHGTKSSNQVMAADFAPDDASVWTVDLDGSIHQWALDDSRREIREPVRMPMEAGENDEGRSLAVSPMGDVVAVGFLSGAVALIDLTSEGVEAKRLLQDGSKPHAGSVYDIAFSRDGSIMATSSLGVDESLGNIVVWKNSSRAEPAHWLAARTIRWEEYRRSPSGTADLTGKQAWTVDISDDGKRLAFGLGDGRVCLLSLPDGQPVCSSAGHTKTVKAVRFRPEQPVLVSAGNDDAIAVWYLNSDNTMTPGRMNIWQDSDVWDLHFSADGGLLASAEWDGDVRVYDAQSWQPLATLEGHESALRTVRFDSSSRLLLTASLDRTARVWTPFDARTDLLDLEHRVPHEPGKPEPVLLSLAIGKSRDWIAFTNTYDVFIKEKGKEDVTPLPPLPTVQFVQKAALQDVPAILRFSQVVTHPTQAAVVSSAREPSLALWTREPNGEWTPSRISLPGDPIPQPEQRALAIDPSGTMLAVTLYATDQSGILLCSVEAATAASECSLSDPSTRLIPLTADERACGTSAGVWPRSLDFSPSGDLVAAGGTDCSVRVFAVADGAPAMEPVFQKGIIYSVDFAPDEKSVVSASADWTSRIWNLESGESLELRAHTSSVNRAMFSPSGKWVASISPDETVAIFDAANGKNLVSLPVERDSITALDMGDSPRGPMIATGSAGGNLNVMRFFENPQEILEFADSFLETNIGDAPAEAASID